MAVSDGLSGSYIGTWGYHVIDCPAAEAGVHIWVSLDAQLSCKTPLSCATQAIPYLTRGGGGGTYWYTGAGSLLAQVGWCGSEWGWLTW